MRKAGILLHPTSLSKTNGIGTLGKSAFEFIDWLKKSGMKVWQVLPLGPTGYGDSPYQSFSTFALNPLLIDFEDLAERGWATEKLIKKPSYIKNKGPVDFGSVVWWKTSALKEISKYFLELITNPDAANEDFDPNTKMEFFTFCRENLFWLKDYAAFMSIKAFYDKKAQAESEEKKCAVNGSWNVYWPKKLAKHDSAAVEKWINEHTEEFLQTEVVQFFAFKQWQVVHEYAKSKEIEIIGDIPIFVAPDSSDVWANQKLFQIGADGQFKAVAGVPPDYFSKTGQLWGNPIYDYEEHEKTNYDWFIKRIMHHLKMYDIIRLDHFRGYASYYSIPNGSVDATIGKWMEGPKMDLFNPLKKKIKEELNKDLNEVIIAEDLGTLTIDVYELLKKTKLTGMKVLQFGLPDVTSIHMPNNYTYNTIAYIGTHDNDTFMGWFESLEIEKQIEILSFLKCSRKTLMEEVIKLMFNSKARIVIINLTDYLHLSTRARINLPGSIINNWSFKFKQIDYEYLRNYIFENFFDKRL